MTTIDGTSQVSQAYVSSPVVEASADTTKSSKPEAPSDTDLAKKEISELNAKQAFSTNDIEATEKESTEVVVTATKEKALVDSSATEVQKVSETVSEEKFVATENEAQVATEKYEETNRLTAEYKQAAQKDAVSLFI